MKKTLLLATVTIMFVLVLAACSPASGGNGVTPPAPGLSTPTTAPGSGGTQPPSLGTPTSPAPGTTPGP